MHCLQQLHHNRDAQTAMRQRQRHNTASCIVSALQSQPASRGQLKTLLPIITHSLRQMQVATSTHPDATQ